MARTMLDVFSQPFRREPLFDDALPSLFMRPLLRAMDGEWRMPLDVTEEDDAYLIAAEIPGARRDDIKVTVDGNVVGISAESESREEVKEEGRCVRSERYHGAISRRIALDHDVDQAKAEAHYADGVLSLKLPKKAASSSTRIRIS